MTLESIYTLSPLIPVIQSGLGYRFSQYAKVGGFFCEHPGCFDGICMCPFLHGM